MDNTYAFPHDMDDFESREQLANNYVTTNIEQLLDATLDHDKDAQRLLADYHQHLRTRSAWTLRKLETAIAIYEGV